MILTRKTKITAGVALFGLAVLGAVFALAWPRTAVAEGGREETEGPRQAWEWRRKGQVDELGRIPIGAWQNARNQIAQLAARSVTRGTEGWREIGPTNVAGRTRSFIIDPTNAQKMFMGAVGGGIWRSLDGGATWNPVSDKLDSLAIGCMTFQPGNSSVIYAGTGEGFYNSDALDGSGILKSTDGGDTWTMMPSTTNFPPINRIAVSPTDGNRILVASPGGVRLSTDGGVNWTLAKFVQQAHQVVFHPTDGTKALMTVDDYDFNTLTWHITSYYSTNGGANWTEATGLKVQNGERIELAYAPSNTAWVYACSSNNGGEIWRSTNGGQSYVLRGTAPAGANEQQWWYDNSIWVHNTNANRIVFAGANIYRSADGGTTSFKISDGYILTQQPHPDVHAIVSDPGFDGINNLRVYVATDGGIFKAENIMTASTTTGWSNFSTTARTTQFYGAIGDGNTNRVIGGTQDNGTLKTESFGPNATYPWGGDGGWVAMDPADPNIFYGEYVFSRIFRTTNGGPNADYIYSNSMISDGGNFIAPFILDPNDSNRLLAGARQLWRTNSAKAASVGTVAGSWTSIKAQSGGTGGDVISAIAVAPGNSDIIWVGHNNGKLYKTTNGTAVTPTWTSIDTNSAGTDPLPNRYIHRILVDPSDNNKVYVALGGFTPNNFFRTTTGGTSWEQRTGTGANVLPSAPIRAIARHPNDANLLYVGTEVGICTSTDGGANWLAPSTGPLNVSVDELRFMNNSTKLLAATHGRGLWVLGPIGVDSLTGPAQAAHGASPVFEVTLDGVAGTGGVDVSLSSSNPAVLPVPSTMTVNAGQKSGTFMATATHPVSDTQVTITASLNGTSRDHVITITGMGGGAVLASASVTPTTVVGGTTKPIRLTVTLESAAPSGGATVSLSSNNAAVTVPATLKVPAGATSKYIKINTTAVNAQQVATLTASLNGVDKTTTLTVVPPTIKTHGLNLLTVYGGSNTTITGTVVLNGPAPSNGVTVSLTTNNAAAANLPASVSFNPGEDRKSYTVTHFPVTVDRTVILRAIHDATTKRVDLVVKPAAIYDISVTPKFVTGGLNSATVTVTLNAAAATGGANVVLTADPALVSYSPSTVFIPAGQNSGTSSLTFTPVATDTVVTLKATRNGEKVTTITIRAPTLNPLTITPSTFTGGSATVVSGTVALNAPAPAGGLVVNLQSSDTSAATVPATVTVPAGQTTAPFTVTHFSVGTQKSVTITATVNASSRTKVLTINP